MAVRRTAVGPAGQLEEGAEVRRGRGGEQRLSTKANGVLSTTMDNFIPYIFLSFKLFFLDKTYINK